MSLILDAGEIAFTGADGSRRLSSFDQNLRYSATIATAFTINAVDRRSAPQLISDVDIFLATVPANSNFILGHTIISGRKRSIGGDTMLFLARENMQNASTYNAATGGTGVVCFASTIWYRVYISGTQLLARVSYRFPSAARAVYAGATVQVRAFVGVF